MNSQRGCACPRPGAWLLCGSPDEFCRPLKRWANIRRPLRGLMLRTLTLTLSQRERE